MLSRTINYNVIDGPCTQRHHIKSRQAYKEIIFTTGIEFVYLFHYFTPAEPAPMRCINFRYFYIYQCDVRFFEINERIQNTLKQNKRKKLAPAGALRCCDNDFVVYVPFNIILVISRRWADDNERLCTMKRRTVMSGIPPPAGFEPIVIAERSNLLATRSLLTRRRKLRCKLHFCLFRYFAFFSVTFAFKVDVPFQNLS